MIKIILIHVLILIISCQNEINNHKTNIEDEPKHPISSLLDSTSNTKNESKSLHVVDSSKIEELKKSVSLKKDEYKELTWFKPKSAPKFRSSNAIYCYFAKDSLGVKNFRFVIQYYNDDWLFIEYYRFVIDGKPYSYHPVTVERDNGYGGFIWEWSDAMVYSSDLELIKALGNSKTAKIRFEGRQYYDEKTLTKNQINDIKTILDLYYAMGGTFRPAI